MAANPLYPLIFIPNSLIVLGMIVFGLAVVWAYEHGRHQ